MALIECYECKQRISSTAPACIHCGAPAGTVQAATSTAAPVQAPLSFGRLPEDEKVARVTPAAFGRKRKTAAPIEMAAPMPASNGVRPVELWLKLMIFFLPPFFVWFLLRRGHSVGQRLLGFGWLGLMILLSKA
ncbi:hypothetical protein [Pseudomonas mandelii]|jgi:hypothetical protein|uniref:Zinc ribbon domain-containing protein n=1 Tax=Pseudomonas mandelii TaxID=75612 RepID=A0ABY0VRF0_9PSED|nr:hypothetical protein [Pseudomonas mandelii]MBU0522828.1 hypothetical protein [Gammaproteobacteria bacterium]MBU0817248.1 hypothetical protein [Gammaproteobacteria bacterium]MBU0843075.1 hypothetical protein [Gammaproteobacteria bacterium]MBU1843255.1 hypothetical protein [Gammaproteobacteria bacterium]TWS07621.1 hypothetical protein FJD35_25545 [Pseudomonas mandelii]